MARINSLLIKPSGPDCNLNCTYCFYNSKGKMYPDNKTHRMSEETLEKVIFEYLKVSENQCSFGWQGGEPTLVGLEYFKKAVDIIKKYKRPMQQVGLALQTNGLLLDREWAAFLKESNFLVGLSMDGPAEIHDHNRVKYDNSPSHMTVFNTMQMLKEEGVEFNVLTVVSKANAKRLDDIYDYLKDNGSSYLQFIPCVEVDRAGVEGIAPFSLSPEEYGDFLIQAFDKWLGDGMPQNYVRLFDEMLIAYVDYRSPSCYFSPKCTANLVVEHNGDIYPCDFFVENKWLLGNINETTFDKIADNPLLQQFIDRKQQVSDECRQCKWFSLCFGDCPKYRLNEKGEYIDHAYFCEGYKKFFEYSQPKMLELKKRLLFSNDPRAQFWRKREASLNRNDECICGSGMKYKKCCAPVKAVL